MTPWERVAYDLGQTARVAWFLGHALLAERLTPPLLDPDEVPRNLPTTPGRCSVGPLCTGAVPRPVRSGRRRSCTQACDRITGCASSS